MKRTIKILLCIFLLTTITFYFLKKESAAVIYVNINLDPVSKHQKLSK